MYCNEKIDLLFGLIHEIGTKKICVVFNAIFEPRRRCVGGEKDFSLNWEENSLHLL